MALGSFQKTCQLPPLPRRGVCTVLAVGVLDALKVIPSYDGGCWQLMRPHVAQIAAMSQCGDDDWCRDFLSRVGKTHTNGPGLGNDVSQTVPNRETMNIVTSLLILAGGLAAGYNIQNEKLQVQTLYTAKDALDYNGGWNDFVMSSVATFGHEHIFMIYLDKHLRVRTVHVRQKDGVPFKWKERNLVNNDYRSKRHWYHAYSMGVDEGGHIHVSGDNHDYPYIHSSFDHLHRNYHDRHCLLWRTKKKLDPATFEFRGKDPRLCLGAEGVTFVRFFNAPDYGSYPTPSRLYAHYREVGSGYRKDLHPDRGPALKRLLSEKSYDRWPWEKRAGVRALGMSRWNQATKRWEALGGKIPGENGRMALAYEHSNPAHRAYPRWLASATFDKYNGMHVVFIMNGEPGKGREPSYLVHLLSTDWGNSFHSHFSTRKLKMPVRIATTGSDKAPIVRKSSRTFGPTVGVAALHDDRRRQVYVMSQDLDTSRCTLHSTQWGRPPWIRRTPSNWPSREELRGGIFRSPNGVFTMQTTKGLFRFKSHSDVKHHMTHLKKMCIDDSYFRRTGKLVGAYHENGGNSGPLKLVMVTFKE